MPKDTKNPTIVQFEGEDFYRAVANIILFEAGMQVNRSARNIKETRKLVEEIQQGSLKPDLAIIDSLVENTHNEGKQIAAKLKELVPGIKVISYTILDDQDWGDYLALKSNRDPQKTLVKALEEILQVDLSKSNEIDRS